LCIDATHADLLGKLQLEGLEAVETESTAETNNRGITNLGLSGQVYYTHVDYIVRVSQNEVGNLCLGLP
jgi:hypothetical protein